MQFGTKIASLITRVEAQGLVADLYNQGMPIKEIAAQVPVSLATVYKWINLPNHKSIKQKRNRSQKILQPVVIQRNQLVPAIVIVKPLYWRPR